MEEFIMARQSKREYLRSIYKRYQHAGRAEKGRIEGRCQYFACCRPRSATRLRKSSRS